MCQIRGTACTCADMDIDPLLSTSSFKTSLYSLSGNPKNIILLLRQVRKCWLGDACVGASEISSIDEYCGKPYSGPCMCMNDDIYSFRA